MAREFQKHFGVEETWGNFKRTSRSSTRTVTEHSPGPWASRAPARHAAPGTSRRVPPRHVTPRHATSRRRASCLRPGVLQAQAGAEARVTLPERLHDLLERLRVVHGASRVCQVERFWKFTTSSMRSRLNNNKSRCSCDE